MNLIRNNFYLRTAGYFDITYILVRILCAQGCDAAQPKGNDDCKCFYILFI